MPNADLDSPSRMISYCTNVHAGSSFEQVRANLARHATAVRRIVAPRRPLPVGLWLSRGAAKTLRDRTARLAFRAWLEEHHLVVGTMNGFPANDFHGRSVKEHVYQPDWTIPVRLEYTRDLVAILADLLPEGVTGSISTLPLGWRPAFRRLAMSIVAGHQLMTLARELAHLEAETGRYITIDLEPEPGCVLERSADLVSFFEERLLRGEDEAAVRRHLGVCHDVCHAAVMFEPQTQALENYRRAGIRVGKVQISSAVRAVFDGSETQRTKQIAELEAFAEDRYLHQTVIRRIGRSDDFHSDLPAALAAEGSRPDGEWRVHFHVPIFAERLGSLATTQADIDACLDTLREHHPETAHLEVETYAWDVLPEEHRATSLADGIAQELTWLESRLGERDG